MLHSGLVNLLAKSARRGEYDFGLSMQAFTTVVHVLLSGEGADTCHLMVLARVDHHADSLSTSVDPSDVKSGL